MQAFQGLTIKKLKTGMDDGFQKRKIIQDPQFKNLYERVELEAWKAFLLMLNNFLDNKKATNYVKLVSTILIAFRNFGFNMSMKMNYLLSDLDRFPENL